MDKYMMEKSEMNKMMGEKIKKLMGEGKKRSQAIAIAISMARRHKNK